MTQNHETGMKAILGIVLMVNLAMVPFYNAAIAKGSNEPVPYTPDTTPEWSFGSAEDGAGVATVAAGVMGVVGVVGVEADDPTQDMFDFRMLAFETVFDRAYDEDAAVYLFEQPLDESTCGTVVFGWNAANESVDALALLVAPIDVSGLEPDKNGTTIISAAYIAGTLEGVGKQGFWGISVVYDFADGMRYNNLVLLSDLDSMTEQVLMANPGVLDTMVMEPGLQHGPAGVWGIPIVIGGSICALKIAWCLDDVVDAWALCIRGCNIVYANDDTGRARCRTCCDTLRVGDAKNCGLSCGFNGPDNDYAQCYEPPFAPLPVDDDDDVE